MSDTSFDTIKISKIQVNPGDIILVTYPNSTIGNREGLRHSLRPLSDHIVKYNGILIAIPDNITIEKLTGIDLGKLEDYLIDPETK